MFIRISSLRSTLVITLLCFGQIFIVFGQTTVNPATQPDYAKYNRKWLSLGIAATYAYFNSGATYYDKINNRRIYLSPEGQFGVNRTQFIPAIYGFLHPAKRHWVGFSYFTFNREGHSGQVDRDLGDYKVNGNIYMSDRSSFYYLSYNYLLFHDDRAYILGALGLYGIHIKAEVEARGDIKINGEPIESRYHKNNVDRFAPFPLIGLQVGFNLTERWFIGANASIVGGEYQGMSAFVFESKLFAHFVITKNFSILGKLMFFNADTQIDEEKQKTKAQYDFTALFLGIDIGY